jgi:hypothetical protein
MKSTYYGSDLSFIKINDREYAIHHHILKRLAICDILFNDDIHDKKNFHLQIPISHDIIIFVFDCLYGNTEKLNYIFPLKYMVDVMSFMKYVCIENDFIETIIKKMMESMTLIDFYDQLNGLDFCNYIAEIFRYDKFKTKHSGTDEHILKIINLVSCPMDFKTELLTKNIINMLSNYDVIFAVKWNYLCSNRCTKIENTTFYNRIIRLSDSTISFSNIISDYKKFDLAINNYVIQHDNNIVTKIIINNKEIKILPFRNLVEERFIGFSIIDSIADHIAQVLLGIETI